MTEGGNQMKDKNETSGSVIVAWDFSKGVDTGVLIVGKQEDGGAVKVVNAFQGEEAMEILRKLTVRK